MHGTMIVGWADSTARASPPGPDLVPSLVVVEGTEAGLRIEIGEEPAVIGRAPDCHLVLRDTDVSRRHCRVAVLDGEVVVTDLGSTNGTRVDGRPLGAAAILSDGGLLQVGTHVLRLERRSRRELEQALHFDRGIERASRYVRSLLPPPVTEGPLRTDWLLLPCARLGGDAFGHHAIDEHCHAIYLLDVSGHGVEAAMHAVAVINTLRQAAPAGADPHDPAAVVEALSAAFPMEAHGYLFFTIWYGVYDTRTRRLAFCSAGHPPAMLSDSARATMRPLATKDIAAGVVPHGGYGSAAVDVQPGSTLYLFSDGVYEIVTESGRRWEIDDLLPLLGGPAQPGLSEPERIYRAVRAAARPGPFEDDFSLLAVTFP